MVYISHVYVSMALVAFIYVRILREALRPHQRAIAALQVGQQEEQQSRRTAAQHKENMNMLKNMSIIVGLFALAWLPFCINLSVIAYAPRYSGDLRLTIYLYLTVAVMCNSVINPFVYALRFQKFKRAFKIMLLCKNDEEVSNDLD